MKAQLNIAKFTSAEDFDEATVADDMVLAIDDESVLDHTIISMGEHKFVARTDEFKFFTSKITGVVE